MPRGQYPRKKGRRARKIKQDEPELIREPVQDSLANAAKHGVNSQGQALIPARYVKHTVHKVIIKQETKSYFSDGTFSETTETFPAVYTEWE